MAGTKGRRRAVRQGRGGLGLGGIAAVLLIGLALGQSRADILDLLPRFEGDGYEVQGHAQGVD